MLKYSTPIMFTTFCLGIFFGWLTTPLPLEIDNMGNQKLGEIHHHDKATLEDYEAATLF